MLESTSLFVDLLANCDVTHRKIKMADGSEFEGELGSFIFTDEDLTPSDVIGEVWGGRAAWPPPIIQNPLGLCLPPVHGAGRSEKRCHERRRTGH